MLGITQLPVGIQEMIDIDQTTVRVDVDGYEPIVKISRMAHNSDLSPIDVTQNAFDILSTFFEPLEGVLAMVAVASFLSELYRRGFEIQPTKYASASGYGSGLLTASPNY
jgi:hypothetical protein